MKHSSRITINYKPQKIRYVREVTLPDRLLTLNDIGKHLKEDEKFGFFQREEGGLGMAVDYISIYGFRDETEEELSTRVAKQEKYNCRFFCT